MEREVLYTFQSMYREPMEVVGYRFGKGRKTACIVGAIRGNEIQQVYACSQLIKSLKEIERKGGITGENEILVIPAVNSYSINIGKRFWMADNTDINRMFPGKPDGETTQRIAAKVFEKVSGYSYGIHFASFYMSGNFVPHIRMMDTGYQNASLANLFGMPFVVIRSPRPLDTTTLNYNWQVCGTNGFSVYTSATDKIDEPSAKQAASSVLRFLSRMGVIKYNCHSGYLATVIREDDLKPLKTPCGGIFVGHAVPGQEIEKGQLLARVCDPFEGETLAEIVAPINGIVFFAHDKPTVTENGVVYKIVKRLHE